MAPEQTPEATPETTFALESRPTRPLPAHLAAISGLLMGGADAIPGISGGTIALIIGIYDRFIDSLATVVRAPLLVRSQQGRSALLAAFRLLVPLGVAILTAYYLVTRLLVGPEQAPGILLRPVTAPICYGFFFGLVLASLREPWHRIRRPGVAHIALALVACAAAALFVGLPYREAEPALWMLALGGAAAIAVMLLPGVSGSLLLVILGQYATVAGALHDRDIAVIAVFGAGVLAGVAMFVPFLRLVLARHHDLAMAALTGLMAGSLRALWPYKTSYAPKAGPMINVASGDHVSWVLLAGLVGAFTVWLLARLERRILLFGGILGPDRVKTPESRE